MNKRKERWQFGSWSTPTGSLENQPRIRNIEKKNLITILKWNQGCQEFHPTILRLTPPELLNSVESPLGGQKHFLALPNTIC